VGLFDKAKKLGRSIQKGASAAGLSTFANQYDVKKLVTDPKRYAKDLQKGLKSDLTRGAALYGAVTSGNYAALSGEAAGIGAEVSRAGGAKISKAQEAKLRKTSADAGGIYGAYQTGGAEAATMKLSISKNFGKLSSFAKGAQQGVKLAQKGATAYAAVEGATEGGGGFSANKAAGALGMFGEKNPLAGVSGVASTPKRSVGNKAGKSSAAAGESAAKPGPKGEIRGGGIVDAIASFINSIFS
jgi:hypothetical protein